MSRGRSQSAPERLTDHHRHRFPVVLAFLVLLGVIAGLVYWGWIRVTAPETSVTLAA